MLLLLFLLGSGLGLLGLKLVFAIVHNLADDGITVWRDLNQIETCLPGCLQRLFQ